ncbi:unnamed protein product [Closterium sp. NIES-65]|nr:unnamed protein product [Closterium sp. NIES-65]
MEAGTCKVGGLVGERDGVQHTSHCSALPLCLLPPNGSALCATPCAAPSLCPILIETVLIQGVPSLLLEAGHACAFLPFPFAWATRLAKRQVRPRYDWHCGQSAARIAPVRRRRLANARRELDWRAAGRRGASVGGTRRGWAKRRHARVERASGVGNGAARLSNSLHGYIVGWDRLMSGVGFHAQQDSTAAIFGPPDGMSLREGDGEEGDDTWWDAQCLFHPVVLPPAHAAVAASATTEPNGDDSAATSAAAPAAAAAAAAAAAPPQGLDELAAGGLERYWRMYYYGRSSNTWGEPTPSPPSSSASTPLPALPALFTTGSIGLAISSDGMTWTRVRGPEAGGAILTPRLHEPVAFDSLHVGCGDVVWVEPGDTGEEGWQGGEGNERGGGVEGGVEEWVEGARGKGEWWMFYFGGGREAREVRPGVSVHGATMRIGIATSRDGIHFHRFATAGAAGAAGADGMSDTAGALSAAREGVVVDVGAAGQPDDLFVAWPRVLTPSMLAHTNPSAVSDPAQASLPQNLWLMTYSAMSSASPSCVLLASSPNGLSWTRHGPILSPGAPGAWDAAGVGRRHVTVHGGVLAMWYEGVGGDGRHGIGLAISRDGFTWGKVEMEGYEPGGPVFGPWEGRKAGEEESGGGTRGKGEPSAVRVRERERDKGGDGDGVHTWEDLVVAAPHVVCMGDGSMRLYYAARGTGSKSPSDFKIGVAFGRSSELGAWRRAG